MLRHEGTEGYPSLAVAYADAGSITYPPGGTHGPRRQMNYQLVLMDSGWADIEIDGAARRLEQGHVALLRPGHREMFRFASNESARHRWIHIRCEPGTPEDVAVLERLPFAIPLREPIGMLTDRMLDVQERFGRDEGMGLLLPLALSALHQYVMESRRDAGPRALHPAVAAAEREMRARYREPLTVSGLAKNAHVTPEHLVRLFRRDLRTTPAKRLWRIRTGMGIDLLRATGLSVGEIAERCGFRTSYHFARVIKAETGMTPTELRRASLEGRRGRFWGE